MPKVIFKFDKEKDLWNIWKTCNFNSGWHDFKKGLNSNILKIAEREEFRILFESHAKKKKLNIEFIFTTVKNDARTINPLFRKSKEENLYFKSFGSKKNPK